MQKQFFIFRHGQTDWNVAKKVQGCQDIPLNQNGIEEAKQLAKKLVAIKLDIIVSSPLSRALKTAQIVAMANKTPIIINENLKERNFGLFQGKIVNITNNPNELQTDLAQDKLVMPASDMQNVDFRPPNGESLNDVQKRVSQAILDIAKNIATTKIGISTHGGVIRAIVQDILGDKCEAVHAPNTGYIILNWDGQKLSLAETPEWVILCNKMNNSR